MSVMSVKLAVLNSLLFVRDRSTQVLPAVDGYAAVWSTPSCIAVSCLPDCDGETLITLGPAQAVQRRSPPLIDAVLQTPGRNIRIETVLAERILEIAVAHTSTRLRIWTNGHRAADLVVVGVE